ncbi:ABC transporter permease [Tundrisphaera sp. TA3]|uniref:ABC transporter permease n=1 Tax=Tundrisphaera sp. TA3 TaxID=3435775 RepID=UPI003EBE6B57
MKFLGMVLRNVRRNPIRTFLTVGSLTISLFLSMILISFSTMGAESAQSARGFNRIAVLSSQGFTSPVPIALRREVDAMPEVVATTPFSWYGGKYNEEPMPFAMFGVDPATFFEAFDEFTIPADQLAAWKVDKAGSIIGRKLAESRNLKVGDPLPLKDGVYPINLNTTIRGIYDGPSNRDLRTCYFHWEYLDEGLRNNGNAGMSGNAGMLFARCKDAGQMAAVCRRIDASTLSSNNPTKSQSEEAFANMFNEMAGDFKWIIIAIGLAVGISLLCVAGNAMAMALRERTTEVAVLKAIGFQKPLVIGLILAEAVSIAALGGLFGAIGCKLLCDVVDLSEYSGGFLPFFYVPWSTALIGMGASLFIGLASGLVPAIRAAQLSVVNGLRKVV